MINIKVCQESERPYDGWTDGGKYLLDLMGVSGAEHPKFVTRVIVDAATAHDFIDTMPPVSTFFVIANIRDVYKLVQAFPDRDIRMVLA